LGVIYRNIKKWIKESVLIGKWINGLNQMMRASNDTVVVENGSIDMMRGGTMRGGMNDSAAASVIGAWNDTAAVDNGLIHETVDPLQNKTADKSQNLGPTNLFRGGSNNTVVVSKISCPVIDMNQYFLRIN
jgi:hypothetical protein